MATATVTERESHSAEQRARRVVRASSGWGLVWLAAALLCLSLPASGQLYSGSIAGTVSDPTGAVVTGAQVVATDADKGFTYKGTTDNSGRYVLRSIPPGNYSVVVEAPNFEREKKSGIVIAVNQNAGVDFTLKVGAASMTVEVQAQHVELQTEDATTGQVVDRKFINDLPLVGRSVLDLAYLTPGITEVDNSCRGCMANNFTSNGSRNATADVLLDGVSSTNFEQNSGILAPTYTPSVDAVEEFKVQQSNFSAEYGFTGATLINVITRSGTNKFHGSLYEFLRNDKFDANDWFNNQSGGARPPHKLNDFGGTIGGPIVKNKTFFFFDYEGTRERSFGSNFLSVPTADEKGGDFGVLCTSRGASFDSSGLCSDPAGQIYDPYTGTPDAATSSYATNRTPIKNNKLAAYASPGSAALAGTPFDVPNPGVAGNLIDPVANKLMQFFPDPNLPNAGLNQNFFASGTNQNSVNQFDIKIDHQFSQSKLLSAKYAELLHHGHGYNCFGNEADPCTSGPGKDRSYLFAVNFTQTFTPTLIMNLSYGVTRGSTNNPGLTGDFPSLDPVTDLGFPAYMDNSGHKQIPSILLNQYFANTPTGNDLGNQTFSIIKEGQETHTLLGSMDWVRGKHELKFGAEARLHRINFTQPGLPGGQFGFDCFATASSTNTFDVTDNSGNVILPATDCGSANNGGDSMASFLMGIDWGHQGGVYEIPNDVATQSWQAAAFLQDNFRVTPKLTLNLGLRYELSLPRTERFNRMNWLDPNISYSLTAPGLPDFPVQGGEVFASSGHRYNYDTFYKAFQPRFGFAYQMPHGTVLRGGYGIYFSQPRSGAAGTGPWGYEGYDVQTPWIPTFQNQPFYPGSRISDPFRSFQTPYPDLGPKPRVGNTLGVLNDIGYGATGPIPSISRNIPYEQAWSFGIQKDLPGKIIAQADYVGKKGTHLYLGGFRDQNHLGQAFEQARLAGTVDVAGLATTLDSNPLAPYITDPLSNLSQGMVSEFQDPTAQFHVPFPQFTSFSGDSPPIANSIYHAAQFRVEKGFENGLEFLVTYTVSKSIDGASATDDSISWLGGGFQGNTVSVQNPNDLRPERALSVFDIPQVLQFSYVYALPVGRGKRFGGNMHPVLNGFIGGWQLNGIWRFNNGRPIIMVQTSQSSIPTYGTLRPTLAGQLKVNHSSEQSMLNNYFLNACDVGNTCPDGSTGGAAGSALLETPSYTLGDAPRTYGGVRMPGTKIVNMALFKEFPLAGVREGMRIEFRVEGFNVFNHPQFGDVDSGLGDGSFGTITSLSQSMRELQLGLKFYF
jgi:hypothetical protein